MRETQIRHSRSDAACVNLCHDVRSVQKIYSCKQPYRVLVLLLYERRMTLQWAPFFFLFWKLGFCALAGCCTLWPNGKTAGMYHAKRVNNTRKYQRHCRAWYQRSHHFLHLHPEPHKAAYSVYLQSTLLFRFFIGCLLIFYIGKFHLHGAVGYRKSRATTYKIIQNILTTIYNV